MSKGAAKPIRVAHAVQGGQKKVNDVSLLLLRNSTAPGGLKSPGCVVCACNSTTPCSSQKREANPSTPQATSRTTLLQAITATIWRLKQIQFHNTQGRLQLLVDLRCLNLLYNLKRNASLNLATNSYTSVIINSAVRDKILSACEVTNVSPMGIIHPKVTSIPESYYFSDLSNSFQHLKSIHEKQTQYECFTHFVMEQLTTERDLNSHKQYSTLREASESQNFNHQNLYKNLIHYQQSAL